MFKMGGPRTISCLISQTVLYQMPVARRDHRLYGKGHSLFQHRSFVGMAIIWDLRFLVKLPAHSVSNHFSDDIESLFFHDALYRIRNFPQTITNFRLFNAGV